MRSNDRVKYGPRHRLMRAQYTPIVNAGEAVCVRIYDPRNAMWTGCGKPIRPGQRWDLGHVPGGDPDEYAGPQHASCNRAAGAINGNRNRASKAMNNSRIW